MVDKKACAKRTDVTVACRPFRLVEYIETLNEAQIAAVKRIGFGGLLELKISNYPHKHVPAFLKCFSDGSYVFRAPRKKEFMLCKYDVHDCFLLPLGPNPLTLVPTGPEKNSNSPENNALKDRWREKYGVKKASSSICIGKVFAELEADTEGGDHFCRLFVLVSMSLFLAPTSNNGIDLRLLRAIEDVSAFPQSDWCTYVLQSLVKAGEESLKNPKLYRGCIPFLMISYFQRYDFQGNMCVHDLPLIKHWDEKTLVSRIKGEMENGGLGRLTPTEVKYPRCLNMSSYDVHRREDKCILGNPQPNLLLTAPVHSTKSEKKFIHIELPPGVEDDEDLKDRALDPTHELYLQMQRNAIVFHAWYANVTAKIKRATIDPAGVGASQSTQELLGGEKINQYVAEVEDIAERLKLSAGNAPDLQDDGMAARNKADEVEQSTQQVSEVLRDLANEGRPISVEESVDKAVVIENVEVPTKAVAVSWSQIMGEVGVEARDQEVGVPSESVHPASPVLTDGLTPSAFREALREAMYSEEDIQKAFDAANAVGREAECPDPGSAPVMNELTNEPPNVDAQPGENAASLSQYMDCVFSTAEINNDIPSRDGHAASGLHQDVTTSNVGVDLNVVVEVGNANPTVQLPQWSVSDIPLTFCSTMDLKEAFCGLGPEVSGFVKEDGEVETSCRNKSEAEPLPPPIYVPRSDMSHHPFLLHSISPLACMYVVPENLGCSVDCGAPEPVLHVASQFLRLNKKQFSMVFSLRKEVMDNVFDQAHSFNLVEPLVTYKEPYCIAREDMMTLLPGIQVVNNVIDCWCLLLNYLVAENTATVATSRCFFGLGHVESVLDIWKFRKIGKVVDHSDDLRAVWDLWQDCCFSPFQLNSDLVFIPVLTGDKGHYCCACINFLTEQIEYLDNQSYDEEFAKLPCGRITRITVDELGKYMVTKGLDKGNKVCGFPLVNIIFKWQGVGYNANDCGVYMMLHMLLYCGEAFECNLGEIKGTNLLRAEIAATLILSDVNTEREDVLNRMSAFKELKAHELSVGQTTRSKRSTQADAETSSAKRPCLTKSDDGTPVSKGVGQGGSPGSRPLSAVRSRPHGQGDGLGCSLLCGTPDPNLLLVSRFLKSNKSLISEIVSLRKQVADYCFLDDYNLDNGEGLAFYARHAKLSRGDILSMLPDSPMSDAVIECWSMLLNRLETEENEYARMAFFGLGYMELILHQLQNPDYATQTTDQLYSLWDLFIQDCDGTFTFKADLIFVPIKIDGHFACTCINFKTCTVDLLDHKYYPDWDKSDICKACQLIASHMSDYMDYRSVTRGRLIPTFPNRQPVFDWHRQTINNTESGLFTMMHMLVYEGDTFHHAELERKVNRRYLVIQLAVSLVLSDMNVIREGVLNKLASFIADKEDILKEVDVRRTIKKVLKKKGT